MAYTRINLFTINIAFKRTRLIKYKTFTVLQSGQWTIISWGLFPRTSWRMRWPASQSARVDSRTLVLIRSEQRRWSLDVWQLRWVESATGSRTRLLFPDMVDWHRYMLYHFCLPGNDNQRPTHIWKFFYVLYFCLSFTLARALCGTGVRDPIQMVKRGSHRDVPGIPVGQYAPGVAQTSPSRDIFYPNTVDKSGPPFNL